MDKQAFKQRMQNLKSYRENNPGKGYWDWKVTAYADGGEVKDDRTDHSIAKPIIPQYPIPSYKDGGIHIKKKNRGKFNALKKRTGKSTEELTHSKNPLTRKRAIFAQNAKKWKHKGRKK